MGKFQDVMYYLNPRVIIGKIDIPNDAARGSYVLRSSIVRSAPEFEDVIIDYMDHHFRAVFGGSLPGEYLMSQARGLLEDAEGFDNLRYIGLSGANGGMGYVLNVLVEAEKKRQKQEYFKKVIVRNIEELLDYSDVLELCQEFKNRLSVFSPQSFNYISAVQMAADYKKILWRYIEDLSQYRNLWQY